MYPWDLIASIYELMGIDPEGVFPKIGEGNIRLLQQIGGNIKSGGRLKEIM